MKPGVWEGRQVEYLEGEIAIILKPNVRKADVLPLLRSHGATVRRDFDELGWGLVELPAGVDILSLATQLKASPLVQTAEPNMVDRLGAEPDDPFYLDGHQWGLKNWGQNPPGGTADADIYATEAWEISRGSSSVIIAILDSGIPLVGGSLSHPDLNDAGKFILGPDYADDPPDGVRDDRGHGTHVTGIAAVETDNGTGIAGVCGSCRVMVIQVFDVNGNASHSDFRDGVIYASNNGAHVINYSGGGTPSSTKEQAVEWADKKNVVLVASSGNESGYVIWPAAYSTNYSNVIAVGATDHNDVRPSYSNYGSQLNVVAPGGYGSTWDANDIYSTTPNYDFALESSGATENYSYLAGTSMAAPHVSGLAGLIISVVGVGWITASDVRSMIEETADDKGATGRDDYYGWGRINAYHALSEANGPPAAPQNLQLSGGFMEHPRLTWNANTDADLDRYYVYRRVGSGSWNNIGSTTNTTFTDNDVFIGIPDDYFSYYVKARDVVGLYSAASNTVGVWGLMKDMQSSQLVSSLPEEYGLRHNYPNPFNPSTTLRYDLPQASQVQLTIYDVMGREVFSHTAVEEAGYRQLQWQGKDLSGKAVPSGVYIYRLMAVPAEGGQAYIASRKLVLLK